MTEHCLQYLSRLHTINHVTPRIRNLTVLNCKSIGFFSQFVGIQKKKKRDWLVNASVHRNTF